ncbi:MAG: hypothetical protein RLY31_1101 [Bacteroidota bacterium]
MPIRLFLLTGFLLWFRFLPAQPSFSTGIAEEDLSLLQEYEDTLGLCGFSVVNDSTPTIRFLSCRKMITTLVKALKIRNSFQFPFEQLRTVSILYPPDSTFRIFTWQLFVGEEDYRYFGAIQRNTPDLQLFPLVDRSAELEAADENPVSPERWYGALYYNIHPFEGPDNRTHYLLFGYDGYSFFNRRKLIEVLSFQDGKPLFGAPLLVDTDPASGEEFPLGRLLLEYSAESSVRLNYDEDREMVVHDHLTTMGGNYGQGEVNVPDGTYEGYRLDGGRWIQVHRVWQEVMDEAPRPEPVFQEGVRRDLFGKERKQ